MSLALFVVDPSASDLVSSWASYMRARNFSARTVSDREVVIRRIALEVERPATQLTTEDLLAWFDGRDLAPSSAATYFATVRAWSRWLVRSGHRLDNPCDRFETIRVPRAQPKPITTSQLIAVLQLELEPQTRAKMILGAWAGLRVSEIAAIRGSDFDLAANVVVVRGKGGVIAPVPLHSTVRRLAKEWPSKGWWFPSPSKAGPVRGDSVSIVLGNAMKRAGIAGGHPHQLRHWLATELTRRGVNARVIQTIMRHASISTTERYAQVDDSGRQAAISLLPEDALDWRTRAINSTTRSDRRVAGER